jgi:polynucleotide 5'-hydroxyl-kinase GRC3/NOL9
MSQQGPNEVVESLQEAAKQIQLVTLPSQPTVKIARTAAQLRRMQYMSYFHIDPVTTTDHFWTASPLTSMAPWEVRYAGDGAGILGVMCLGEPPPPAMVRDTIDGTVLVVVVLDDIAAIPAFGGDTFKHTYEYHTPFIEREANAQNESQMGKEWIIQTPEGIPYINREHSTFLNPKYSYTIGLALLRGIDSDRKIFQLLTPISEKTIKDTQTSGKAMVLLSGKLDTPGWAYLEEFHERAGGVTDTNKQLDSDRSDDDSEDSAVEERTDWKVGAQDLGKSFQDAPWIERSHGDQGRGAGARVWRVRRDLGKTGESR